MCSSKYESFMREFKEYIVDTDHKESTAESYKSNLGRSCRILNLGEGFLEAIVYISDPRVQASLCEYMRAKLTEAIESVSEKKQKDSISDCRSAVAMLQEFVAREKDDVMVVAAPAVPAPAVSAPVISAVDPLTVAETDDEKTLMKLHTSAIEALPCESTYTRKDMEKIFKQRLVTQDRYYSDSCLPARLINRINSKKIKRKIYDSIIQNTKFLYAEDSESYILLKDISKLTIKTDGYVKFESKGKEYDLYTAVYSGKRLVGYELMCVDSFSLLSLDHEVAIRNVLPEFLKTHNEFEKFSKQVIADKTKCSGMTVSKFSKYFYEMVYAALGINETLLIDEVCAFIDSLKLVIMHRSYNSGKNDSV